MTDLVTWLRAQLDEDARLIDEYDAFQRGLPVAAIVVPPGWLVGEPFDIGRQRAEVDAKRRILDEHPIIPEQYRLAGRCWRCYDREDEVAGGSPVMHPCPTLRLLALPYADRPGYRDEWRP